MLYVKLLIHHKGVYKAKSRMSEGFRQGADYVESVPFPDLDGSLVY
jgi:hypothetical protein